MLPFTVRSLQLGIIASIVSLTFTFDGQLQGHTNIMFHMSYILWQRINYYDLGTGMYAHPLHALVILNIEPVTFTELSSILPNCFFITLCSVDVHGGIKK